MKAIVTLTLKLQHKSLAEVFFHSLVLCLFSTSVVRLRQEKGEEKQVTVLFNYLMDTYSWRPNNHSCPSCKCHILIVFKAPANCPITDAFLTFFQFFQQTKITRNFYS